MHLFYAHHSNAKAKVKSETKISSKELIKIMPESDLEVVERQYKGISRMVKRSIKSEVYYFMIIVIVLSMPQICRAIDADLIWSENLEKSSRILISRYRNDQWSNPDEIEESKKYSILPALGSDGKGNRLAVWVEIQNDGRSLLKYRFSKKDDWKESEYIQTVNEVNLAPVVVFDISGSPFVFWSSNNGADDDIYMSRWNENYWAEPKVIHEQNDVPDILPTAGLGEDGKIWVCWKYLDAGGEYVERCQIIAPSGEMIESQKQKMNEQAERYLNKMNKPFFSIGKGRATVHFPKERRHQSTTIKIMEEE
jgi:hypothetical protein